MEFPHLIGTFYNYFQPESAEILCIPFLVLMDLVTNFWDSETLISDPWTILDPLVPTNMASSPYFPFFSQASDNVGKIASQVSVDEMVLNFLWWQVFYSSLRFC
jgi:hypothetical protein